MNKNLPFFKYNPNVYDNGIARRGMNVCQCCQQPVDIYIDSMYCRDQIECICFNCISNGEAAKKFDGEFVQDADQIVNDKSKTEELFCRTPGCESWQGELWKTCCDDYCQFLGDVGTEELEGLQIADKVIAECEEDQCCHINRDSLKKGGSLAGYLFQCLHCGKYYLGVDCD